MGTTKLLTLLIDIFYFGVILVSSIVLIGFLYMFFFEPENALIYSNIDLRNMTSLDFALVLCSIIATILFIASLFYLRKSIYRISKNDLYHIDTAKYLKLAGWCIILYSLIKNIGEYIKLYLEEGTITIISLDFKGFNSFWFIMILGLFFQLIATVLENGRKLKLENDLTI